jgi:hypothetical protein
VVNETIKATLLTPYVGVAATCVGFVNQAATLISVGLFSVPCGLAILARHGTSIWFWACAIHAIVLVFCGVALQAATRADALGLAIVRRFPSLAPRAQAFRDHAAGIGLFARGPTTALFVGRVFQFVEYAVAARAVGIDTGVLTALSAQGVSLIASAVGVLVPAGLGTSDGAFTIAADMLDTTAARATSLALLMRCTQLVFLLLGSLVALLGPRRARPCGTRPSSSRRG